MITTKTKTRFAACLAISLLATGAYLLFHSAQEPLHKGKPVSFWVNGACRIQGAYREPYSYGDCIGELRQIGPPAVPYLVAKLRTKDSWPRRKWAALLPKLPPALRKHFSPVPDINELHHEAAWRLIEFGPNAKSAIPELVNLLSDTNLAHFAAIDALGAIGPDAKTALPALKRALPKGDLLTQINIASAIWKIDRETNFVLRIYDQAIKLDPHDRAILNAENDLGEMGTAAIPMVPQLVHQLENLELNPEIRGNAAYALGRIGFKSEEVMSALLDGMKNTNYPSGMCAMALWQLDSKQYAPVVTPTVVRLAVFWSWDSLLNFAASNHLEIAPAIPALREISKNDYSPAVRKLAADALEKIDARADNTITNQ